MLLGRNVPTSHPPAVQNKKAGTVQIKDIAKRLQIEVSLSEMVEKIKINCKDLSV